LVQSQGLMHLYSLRTSIAHFLNLICDSMKDLETTFPRNIALALKDVVSRRKTAEDYLEKMKDRSGGTAFPEELAATFQCLTQRYPDKFASAAQTVGKIWTWTIAHMLSLQRLLRDKLDRSYPADYLDFCVTSRNIDRIEKEVFGNQAQSKIQGFINTLRSLLAQAADLNFNTEELVSSKNMALAIKNAAAYYAVAAILFAILRLGKVKKDDLLKHCRSVEAGIAQSQAVVPLKLLSEFRELMR